MTSAVRDRATGRFTHHEHRCCDGCGSYLAENLTGQLSCLLRRCPNYRQVVGQLPVDAGTIPTDLTPEPET